MPGCYVSPIPARIQPNYSNRDADGWPITERVHLWPRRDETTGEVIGESPCNPRACRECHRERTWHDHGESQ